MLGSVEPERPSGTGDIDPRSLGVVVLVSGLMVLAVGGGMLLTASGDEGRPASPPAGSESIDEQRVPASRLPAGAADPASVPTGAVVPRSPNGPVGAAPVPTSPPPIPAPTPAVPHPVERPVVIGAQRLAVLLPVIAPVNAAVPVGGPGCTQAALLLPVTLPNGGWVCTDPIPAAEQPRLGAPCLTNSPAAHWDLLPVARWVCVPQSVAQIPETSASWPIP
ncbi:hypothetical protein [Nocardia inohanensis]|uniref:hypothetical protein n=1 Tax=Nocardia inohanensis TaxID=209246 RepID=UPI00082992C8|nr:hypothetical protein [Nocardia inohanensis]